MNEKDHKDFLQRQLIKLGDMMGDGLHYEEPWIEKEYSKILKQLHPEVYREKRKKRNQTINTKMEELLVKFSCDCGGILKQTRSGSYTAKCEECGKRYKAYKNKNK